MSVVLPSTRERQTKSYQCGNKRTLYKGSRGLIELEESLKWIISRDLTVVVRANGDNTIFADPLEVDTTPPTPPTREAAMIQLMKKCCSGEITVASPPDSCSSYVHLTKEELASLDQQTWSTLFYEAGMLFAAFPIWEHLSPGVRDGDEWLPTEEAVNEVIHARRGGRSRERASLWLLEAAARGQVIVRNAGYALAYRAAGYAEIWKSIAFTRGPLWSLSSLEAALPRPTEKKHGGGSGRKSKDIWSTIYIEATKYIAYESSDAERMVQADLERWIMQRLDAHGETAAESTVRDKASFILRTFNEAG